MSDTLTAVILTGAAGQAHAIRQPSFRIRVTQGPAKGTSVVLTAPRLILGSAAVADVQIKDPTVSALHCEITCDTTGLFIRDLGSKNGLVLDGRRILHAFLHEKDELRLGASVVRVDVSGEAQNRDLSQEPSFGRLVGSSVVMRDVFGRLARAARSDASVLIEGETGTGKELAIDALIQRSARANAPLVVVDCASLSPNLIESELFGHERGAFTGANEPRAGAFERAHQGTLFLDEIGELPLDLQGRLLGALGRKAIQRVGSTTLRDADVRVLAATHRNLPRMVNRGTFREDLYHRIAAITVRLPALREHPEDIPALVSHFLQELGQSASLPPLTLQHLYDAEYPGNVRELRNCVMRAVAGLEVAPSQNPTAHADTPEVTVGFDIQQPYRAQKDQALDAYERAYLVALLKSCDGNVSEAARRSGLNRVHLYELFRRRRIALP